MTLIFNRLLEVINVRFRAKFYQAKCRGSSAVVSTDKQKKLSDDSENITALSSAASNKMSTHGARRNFSRGQLGQGAAACKFLNWSSYGTVGRTGERARPVLRPIRTTAQ